MKRILSFANKLKLDRQEKPKRASVKKKNPRRFWKPAISFLEHVVSILMHAPKWLRDLREVVEEESAHHCVSVSTRPG